MRILNSQMDGDQAEERMELLINVKTAEQELDSPERETHSTRTADSSRSERATSKRFTHTTAFGAELDGERRRRLSDSTTQIEKKLQEV